MLGISAQSNTLAFTFFAALFEKEREREREKKHTVDSKNGTFSSLLSSLFSLLLFFRLFGAGASKVV